MFSASEEWGEGIEFASLVGFAEVEWRLWVLEGGFAGVGVEGAGDGSADGVGMDDGRAIKCLGGTLGSDSEGVGFEAGLLFLPFGICMTACSEEETSVEDRGC